VGKNNTASMEGSTVGITNLLPQINCLDWINIKSYLFILYSVQYSILNYSIIQCMQCALKR
jgi:hypothetical protein